MNTDNNKQLYGFVYKPRDACDKCISQDAQNKVELVWQLTSCNFSKQCRVILANSADPDQMLHSAAFDLGLHCLPMSQSRFHR